MIRVNLLPRVPKRRLPGGRVVELAPPVAMLALALILGVMVLGQNAGLERQVADVNRQIAELQPVVARVLDLDKQIATLRDREQVILALLKRQLPGAAVLDEIRLLIPTDVWLTALSVPEPSALTLEGLALSYHAVAQLMDNLSTGRLFRVVDLTVVQLERVGPREIVKFSITARIARPEASGGDRP